MISPAKSTPEVFTTSTEEEQIPKLNVTDAETEAEFNEEVKSWLVYNDGPHSIHYSLSSGVDTDNHKIPSGVSWGEDVPVKKIYLICASGENADVYVVGLR